MDVSDDELQDLYVWVDDIPLSRPKRNIARDFSDGVLVAEVCADRATMSSDSLLRHFAPSGDTLVSVCSYVACPRDL